jgi:undecaprenyl-diphosphatase
LKGENALQQKQGDEGHTKHDNEQGTSHPEAVSEHKEGGVEGVLEKAQLAVAAALRPWYQSSRWGSILLVVYAILLALFALLAWWVSYHPILPIDVVITQQFQDNPAPWLHDTMVAISYIGDVVPLFVGLIALAAALFWIVDLRLEAVMVVALSATSAMLIALIKYIVGRPRPAPDLVDVMHSTTGSSFPSGHVMSYIALWGLIFAFTLILFRGRHWWRTALLIVSGLFVVLKGPSRIYLGARLFQRRLRRLFAWWIFTWHGSLDLSRSQRKGRACPERQEGQAFS